MTHTPKTASDSIVTAPSVATPSPPTEPSYERPLPVGDPEVVTTPIISQKPRTAPAPVKI
jgi:hypothetical protein